MDRRKIIIALSGFPFVSSDFVAKANAAQAWSAEFISGNFDGTFYQAGLHVSLLEGWKTYWRNPGEAGIPPTISAVGDNLEELRIDFPLPKRLIDESGEAIGFHNEVVFPLYLKPKNVDKSLAVKLSAFFGVCQQICSPAKLDSDLVFTPSNGGNDAALITTWQTMVPNAGNITSASNIKDGFLVLDLVDAFDDIFVEGPERLYFRKPDFDRERGKAWVKIDGAQKAEDLNNINLRLTAAKAGQGLEQRITLV